MAANNSNSSLLNLNITGVDQLNRLAADFVDEIEAEIEDEINATALEIVGEAKALAPVYDGQIRNGIDIQDGATPLSKDIVVIPDHAIYMEFGTGRRVSVPNEWKAYALQFKGKKNGTFADMIIALTEWVRKKGIAAKYSDRFKNGKLRKNKKRIGTKAQQGQEDRQKALEIASYILRNGLKPRPFLYPAYKKATKDLPARISAVIQDAINRL